jgi:glycosyltransferase involved in cell wall biosynthesis
MLGPFLTRRPDVIYAYHPPLTVGLAAAVLGLIRRAPFVYDIQDLWPDTLAATGMMRHQIMLRLVDRVAKWIYRKAAYVVAQSPGFEQELLARGVPARKVRVIYNWCTEEQSRPGSNSVIAEELHVGAKFNVVFAGTMGKAQGLASVLQAAKLLDRPDSRVQFTFIGGGIETESLTTRAEQLGLSNVLFLPRVPMSEVGQVLSAADVLLVHLKDDPLFEITIPGKTQAYLAAGKPVLMGVRGDAADLVTESGGGLTCEPEDPESLAEVVTRLEAMEPGELAAMGERGQAFYRSELSLVIGTRKFIRVFEQVVNGG